MAEQPLLVAWNYLDSVKQMVEAKRANKILSANLQMVANKLQEHLRQLERDLVRTQNTPRENQRVDLPSNDSEELENSGIDIQCNNTPRQKRPGVKEANELASEDGEKDFRCRHTLPVAQGRKIQRKISKTKD